MNNRIKIHLKKYGPYWAIFTVSILYILLNWNRYFVLYDWADVDDTMQYDLSRSLSEGEWLGPYTRATLVKGIVFPLWAAGLHTLHIPLWLGTTVITVLAGLALIYALRRLIRNKWMLALIYGLVILNPMITERAYRDYLLPAIILFLCAWAIGIFTTVANIHKGQRRIAIRDIVIYTLIGIVSLPAWYFTREDGYWVLPLVGGLFVSALIIYLRSVRWNIFTNIRTFIIILTVMIAPFMAVWLAGTLIANKNESYYGRNTINDYFSSDFGDAYGSLTRINDHTDRELTVPITYEMREKIYAISPAFNELRPCLDTDDEKGLCERFFKRDVIDAGQVRDYQGGWLPFAIRLAVEHAGHYRTASDAENYYKRLAAEVDSACDKGTLSCHDAYTVSLLPAPNAQIIRALFTSDSSSIWSMIVYLQSLKKDNDAPQPPSDSLNRMAEYYGVRYIQPVEYGTAGTIRNNLLDSIWTTYKLVNPVLMYGSIAITIIATFLFFKRKYNIDWKVLIILWLLMFTIGLRLAMLAYVYTVHFPSTTNIYFTPVYILLFLFEGLSIYMILNIYKTTNKKSSRVKKTDV